MNLNTSQLYSEMGKYMLAWFRIFDLGYVYLTFFNNHKQEINDSIRLAFVHFLKLASYQYFKLCKSLIIRSPVSCGVITFHSSH